MAGTKDNVKTGFYFFWEWQYNLRREFLLRLQQQQELENSKLNTAREEANCLASQCIRNLPRLERIEDFLEEYKQNRSSRFFKSSDQIIEEYLRGDITENNLLDLSPRWFRAQHYAVYCFHDDNGKIHSADDFDFETEIPYDIDPDQYEKALDHERKEVQKKLRSIYKSNRNEDISEWPNPWQKFYILPNDHELLWRMAYPGKLQVNFIARMTGIWLWDKKIESPNKNIGVLVDEMIDAHPRFTEKDNVDSSDYSDDKFKKRLQSAQKNIGHEFLLPW
ncbi:MAG: hypothetical protein K9K39_03275 [Desulfohalobiaceae bacterium]|nr:hypothetical protein [Desulfohalobiaceae bacterium]